VDEPAGTTSTPTDTTLRLFASLADGVGGITPHRHRFVEQLSISGLMTFYKGAGRRQSTMATSSIARRHYEDGKPRLG